MSAAPPNFHHITNAPQFKALLSEDLSRVSLLNFWAPWAAPCAQMNEVVLELARKYPHVLALQIEAEEQSDISESFDIEAVPSFIILRGHTLLARISGADAAALTAVIATHARAPSSVHPLAHTDKPPAAPGSEKGESEDALNTRLRGLMTQAPVVLFMKGSPEAPRCGFSRRIVALLKDNKVQFAHFDIYTDESVRQGLKVLNDWPTFPQLIVKGEFVGGLDVVTEMVQSGEFADVMAEAH
ncbi:glutaredoxin [Auriscalpium vulgare]|uniref:Glutaredoxin n=1 Tax=Auriscalpium vulgare TaxID=40419 RepID=A0ACB8S322_9AGAM|nr:glutaredoxin [Auriscalpium vulgare]